MVFHLIVWKEFNDKKLIDKANIVKTDDVLSALDNVKTMNAQKRLTTTDYQSYNLSELFQAQSLNITESVKTD